MEKLHSFHVLLEDNVSASEDELDDDIDTWCVVGFKGKSQVLVASGLDWETAQARRKEEISKREGTRWGKKKKEVKT